MSREPSPPRACLAVLVLLLSAFATAVDAGTRSGTYVEDFTTTTYKDPSTTACWDTVAGEIKLWPFEMSIMAECQTPGTARSLVVDGALAFIADYAPSGLEVIDISDSTNPTSVGRFTSVGNPRDVTLHGNYAFLMESTAGIEVVDISDPANPTLAGSYNTIGNAYRAKVRGNLLYVADDTGGLLILDVTNPASPVYAGAYYPPSGKIRDVVFRGTHAYLAGDLAGLYVVDITNPTSPVYVGSVDTPGAAQRLAIQGDHIFVADLNGGVQVVDISDPAFPAIIGSHACPGNVNGVFATGTYVYAAATAGLVPFDVSNPGLPVPFDTLATPGDAMEVIVAGDRAYVADGSLGGLQVVRAASALPSFVGRKGIDIDNGTTFFALDGDVIAVPKGNNLLMVDVRTPSQAAVACTRPASGIVSMDMEGRILLMSVGTRQCLRVWDVSDPWNPASLDSLPLAPGAVEMEGNYACVATANAIFTVGMSDPSNCDTAGSYPDPPQAGHFPTPKDVAIAGELAFVSTADRIYMFDVSDPSSPDSVGIFLQTGADEMVVSGGFLYLISGAYFRILDIRDPLHPILLSETGETSEYTSGGIAVDGHLAYVISRSSSSNGWVQVYDVSNPSSPRFVLEKWGYTGGVAVSGDYLYLIDTADWDDLETLQRFERHLDPSRKYAVSNQIDTGGELVNRVRITAAAAGQLTLYLTVDGWSAYQAVPADGAWHYLDDLGGTDLRWMTGHYLKFSSPGTNAACSHLQIDWEYRARTAWIESVEDVPNDQGGAVRVTWGGPYNDSLVFDSEKVPVGSYSVFRRVDPAKRKTEGVPEASAGREKALSLPGDWDFVARVPAARTSYGALHYSPNAVIVPTLADSSEASPNPSVFYIQATGFEPDYVEEVIYYWPSDASDPDSGWSHDNLSPTVPSEGVQKELDLRSGPLRADEAPDPMEPARSLRDESAPSKTTARLEDTRSAPWIESITDVPGEQGRQVRIEWRPSSMEMFPYGPYWGGLSIDLTEYGIFRKVDWDLGSSPGAKSDAAGRYMDNWDLVMLVPPKWDWVTPYSTVVPTLADSTASGGTHWSKYVIRAFTWSPGYTYASNVDSGYSVDNLSPRAPYGLALAGSSTLSWRASQEKDWDYYAVYANPDSGSTPESSSLLGYTIDTTFVLPDSAAGQYVLVTASDFSGNESEPSENLAVSTDVAGGSIPASYYLAPNVPNPFNPVTTLRFGLPRPGPARVSVHDVAGREVVVLVDEHRRAGQFYLNWDGRDASGREAGSGVYFARMTAGDFTAARKMVLVR